MKLQKSTEPMKGGLDQESTVRSELAEKETCIKKLKKRYEVSCSIYAYVCNYICDCPRENQPSLHFQICNFRNYKNRLGKTYELQTCIVSS